MEDPVPKWKCGHQMEAGGPIPSGALWWQVLGVLACLGVGESYAALVQLPGASKEAFVFYGLANHHIYYGPARRGWVHASHVAPRGATRATQFATHIETLILTHGNANYSPDHVLRLAGDIAREPDMDERLVAPLMYTRWGVHCCMTLGEAPRPGVKPVECVSIHTWVPDLYGSKGATVGL